MQVVFGAILFQQTSLWVPPGHKYPTYILIAFVDGERATKYPSDELQLSAGRQTDQSYPGGCLKKGVYEVFLLVIKRIIVPFYSLHVELSIKRQQERARTIILTPHRPFLK